MHVVNTGPLWFHDQGLPPGVALNALMGPDPLLSFALHNGMWLVASICIASLLPFHHKQTGTCKL